jgi:phage terminase large subunit
MAFDEPAFALTPKQEEIAALLAGPAKHSLIYGGSRSGKTFALCWAIANRAIKAPGSRHAIFRRHGVAVKQSIGKDTFPKVMALAFPGVALKWHDQDGYFTVGDGSEVWLAGLDDKERVDKVLGKEFATLYFNEASEIPYASYIVAQTRLAQKVARFDGQILPLRSFVDLNPTARQHWTYRLYVDGVEP